eukprot:scaffold3259_cov373-Prasinococcus_capsulatus_cf.AAC.4
MRLGQAVLQMLTSPWKNLREATKLLRSLHLRRCAGTSVMQAPFASCWLLCWRDATRAVHKAHM